MADKNDINRGVAAMDSGGLRLPSALAGARGTSNSAEPRAENFFEFRDVCKSFDDNAVLKDVSFSVKRAETCVIMGRSGVGKSVSLKHIMGFMKADSGRIFVDGVDVTDFTEQQFEEVRRKVTMVFQSGALFDSLTVAENVAFPLVGRSDSAPAEEIDRRVKELLEMLEVTEFANRLPSDLATGTKRAVAIARALAESPEAILYDEPTTMVDPLMAQLLGDLIKRLKTQLHLTSLVVTHDMRLAKKLANRIVFLHEGKVLFFGTYPEMEKCGQPIIQEFLELDEFSLKA